MSRHHQAAQGLLTALDLAHLFALEGAILPRATVLSFLARTGAHSESSGRGARERRFDRAKAILRREGFEVESDGEVVTFRRAVRARERLHRLIDEARVSRGLARKVLDAVAARGEDGVRLVELKRELMADRKDGYFYSTVHELTDDGWLERVPHALHQNRVRLTEWALERSRGAVA